MVFAGLVLTAGCGGRPTTETLLELAEALPLAEIRQEPGRIDLGTPAANLVQLEGWSWDETPRGGPSLTWGVGAASRLEIFVIEPRALPLRARSMPYDIPGVEAQRVRIEVNGEAAGEWTLGPGWQETELDLPESLLRPGSNELAFHYSRGASPKSLGRSSDSRWLAVAWDWVEVGTAPGSAARADPARGLLHLPAGTRTDYFFELPVPARLSARLARRSSSGLRVEALLDGSATPQSVVFDSSSRTIEMDLAPGLNRLRLEAPVALDQTPPVALRDAVLETDHELPLPADELASAPACGSDEPPDVFVYLIDTLRADRLSLYGHMPEVSPALAAFSGDAVLFEAAIAQSSWTKASVASIFTGLWPWSHGVQGLEDRLPDDLPSLPRLLHNGDYQTAAVVANPHISAVFGFDDGFEEFRLLEELTTPSETVHAAMLELLDRQMVDRPRFGYVHTIDPHAPYAPPEPYRTRFAASVRDLELGTVTALAARAQTRKAPRPEEVEALTALYDAEIAYNDYELGRFFDGLRQRGLYEDALIIVVSDHGEEFYDHGGWTHGKTLYSEVVHVPLLIKFPDGAGAGRRVSSPVQHLDLLPTILDCAGLANPPGLQGESLARSEWSDDHSTMRPRPMLSYLHYSRYDGASVVLGDWKLIVPIPGSPDVARELYHRLDDPAEQRDLAEERPVMAGYLATLLRRALAESPAGRSQPVQLDDNTARRLRALGYLN